MIHIFPKAQKEKLWHKHSERPESTWRMFTMISFSQKKSTKFKKSKWICSVIGNDYTINEYTIAIGNDFLYYFRSITQQWKLKQLALRKWIYIYLTHFKLCKKPWWILLIHLATWLWEKHVSLRKIYLLLNCPYQIDHCRYKKTDTFKMAINSFSPFFKSEHTQVPSKVIYYFKNKILNELIFW